MKDFFKKHQKTVDILENERIISICMDTNNYGKIPECGSLDDLTWKKIVVGAKQLKKALANGCARCVFLAENADPAITEPFAELCSQKYVPLIWVGTMSELGRACGIEVGAAAAAVID